MIAFFLTMPIRRMIPITAITLSSVLHSSSATSAPTPAEGSVERIVIGWTSDSYKIPSTMYTVASAAAISTGWLASESRNACAVPVKVPWIPAGSPISAMPELISSTADPSATPGFRLNEMVMAGNRPWWLTVSGAAVVS